jgi:hypothetical protein
MKYCFCCGITKSKNEFSKNKCKKDGLATQCKSCSKKRREKDKEKLKEYHEIYRKNNKEKTLVYAKEYRENNKEKVKEYFSKIKDKRKEYDRLRYIELNKNKIKKRKRGVSIQTKEEKLLKQKEYYQKNKEKIQLKHKEYRERNREKTRKRSSEYEKIKKITDPSFKIKKLIRASFYVNLKISKIKKTDKFFKYTEIKLSDYIDHFKNNYPEEFLKITEKGKYHIDHIIPCSAYDLTNNNEIKKCWNPKNLRIIPAKENLKKYDKIDYDLIKKYNIQHLIPNKLKRQ